jgi:hypothetical protein
MVAGERSSPLGYGPAAMTGAAPGGDRPRRELFLAPLPADDDPPGSVPEELSLPAAQEDATAAGAGTDRRRRAGTAAGLLLTVALVAASLLAGGGEGEGGGAGEAEPMATTTTTARQATHTETATSSAAERPPLGPLLPEATGAALVVVTSSEVLSVELDTGAVSSLAVAGWNSYHAVSVAGGAVVVESADGVVAVPVATGGDPLALSDRGHVEWVVPSEGPGHLWLLTFRQGLLEGQELSVEGKETGRRLSLPEPVDPRLVAVAGGLVVHSLGSLSLYDPDTGDVRAIGHGAPLAGSGDTLAKVSCEALRCGLQLTDLRTGGGAEVRLPDQVRVMPHERAALSPDGRWLGVGVTTVPAERHAVALVDVEARRFVGLYDSSGPSGPTFAFSPDSRWLFRLDGVRDVVAHRLGTEENRVLHELAPSGAVALAAVPLAG